MSDTIEQSARATTTPELHPKIEEMLARIAGEAGSEAGPGTDTAKERAQAVSAFARALLRRLAEDDLEAITTDELYALATSAFAFADSRGLEPSAVRVFNADPDVHGYRCHGTVVEVATDDSPFLVDSVSEELTARGLTIKRLLHPVIGAVRDEQGRLVQVRSGREAEHRESFMHFEVDRTLGDEVNAELETRVRRILRDVSLVVRDFDPMQERVRHMVDLARGAEVSYAPEVVGEVAKFLEWLLQLNFVLLGYREYELLETKEGRAIRAVSGSGLGILSDVAKSTFSELTLLADLSPDVRNRIEDGELLIYSKTQAYSTVHRRARMDYIGVRKVASDGSIVGEARLIGLFTSKAYMEPAAKTPLLHHKLEQLIAAEDLIPGSHDYKAVVSLFESFPKDELFQASAEELRGLVAGLLQLEKHGGIRVLIRRDLYGRNVSVVVALPRDRFNADLRKRLQGLFLERFHGTTIDYHLSLGETESARIFFTIHVAPGIPIPDVRYEELEREVELLSRSWEDDLLDALTRRVGEGRALALMEEYAPRFPDYYKANDEWDLVVDDVLMLEKLEAATEGFLVGLGNESKGERLTRVKLYKTGGKVDLSDFMPILEALGLRVVEEVPTAVAGEGRVYIHDFGVLDSRGAVLELGASADRVTDTIAAVWRGECDSDSLNRLVTLSTLTWWEVRILRALRNYRMRVSARYTENYRNDAMAAYPSISEQLVRMFGARFDPVQDASDEEIDEIRQAIHQDLRGVVSLDQDNILRHLLGTIEAIARTNAYLPDRSYLSFKLRSDRVPEMPKPTPLYEVWVYSTEMEAIHLRAGRVSRGGIRWSDRREDFRTEVLGLMKAQKVKNAIIVPDGSKGGFVLKRMSIAPEQIKEEVAKQYVTFMEGLLDVTDNLVKGEVVHQEGVRVMDRPDPYLVVAADKGTAPLSDTANEVSRRYGYWLGDAFASGGSYRLRPQGARDHRARGVGVGEASFPGARYGPDDRAFHGDRDRGHVRRRLRQRHALFGSDPPGRGVRSPARLPRSPARSRDVVRGAQAPVRHAGILLGRLRPIGALRGRRGDRSRGEVGHAVRAGEGGPRDPRGRARGDDPGGRDPVGAAVAGRPPLERRHRHVREGDERGPHGGRRSCERPGPHQREPGPRAGGGGGRQPGLHAARADRVRAHGWPDQHRLHRQLRGRRHLRPRGEPEDPARPRDRARRAHHRGPQRLVGGLHGRRRPSRALRQLPAGADPLPGGRRRGRAERSVRGPDAPARGRGGAGPFRRVPSHVRRDGGAPRSRGGAHAGPRSRSWSPIPSARSSATSWTRTSPTPSTSSRTSRGTSPRRSSTGSEGCSWTIPCAVS